MIFTYIAVATLLVYLLLKKYAPKDNIFGYKVTFNYRLFIVLCTPFVMYSIITRNVQFERPPTSISTHDQLPANVDMKSTSDVLTAPFPMSSDM
ncbi:hypothetical protein EB118_12560 [bacterium]|nr:hypothetical protein [bacterium]NDD83058.1 hypothetical protein [bacterium]NDG30891.1 hypothetical protein [bacterium]